MKQLDLDGRESLVQPKAKKKKTKAPKVKRPRKKVQAWGGGFVGDLVPIPLFEGHAITCPCGRVQLYRAKTNMLFFYDKEGKLGDSTLRAAKTIGGYIEGVRIYFTGDDKGIARAMSWLSMKGCGLHADLPSYRDAHLEGFEPAPAFRQTPYR